MSWILNHWKWIVVLLAILIIAYGVYNRTDKKLFNMLAKQYNQEQQQLIENRDEEIAKLEQQKNDVQKQLAQVQKDKAVLQGKYGELQGRYNELENKINNITTPADLDALVDDLRKRGLGSATRAPKPSK